MKLSNKQKEQLNKMIVNKWYKDYEVGNGKVMQVLCDKGLVEYKDNSIVYFGEYKPWKYDKEFRKLG